MSRSVKLARTGFNQNPPEWMRKLRGKGRRLFTAETYGVRPVAYTVARCPSSGLGERGQSLGHGARDGAGVWVRAQTLSVVDWENGNFIF